MNTQVAIQTRPNILNGLDIDAATATIEAIQNDPEIAQFQFRAKNQWINGGENRSTIKGFYGAKAEDTSRSEAWEFTSGEPPVLLQPHEADPRVLASEQLGGPVGGAVVHDDDLVAVARRMTPERLQALPGQLPAVPGQDDEGRRAGHFVAPIEVGRPGASAQSSSRAAPTSSFTSAVRCTNGSSCASRRHWQASIHHQAFRPSQLCLKLSDKAFDIAVEPAGLRG